MRPVIRYFFILPIRSPCGGTKSDLEREIMINYRIKVSKWHKGVECPSYW